MNSVSANGASQQACYAQTGELLTFQRGGGTVDRSGIDSSMSVISKSIFTFQEVTYKRNYGFISETMILTLQDIS